MAKGKRKVPDINSSSTADIAFLLLIFFLITTSMDTDRGLARRLPPPPEQNQKNDDIKLKERNVLQVFLNMNDQLMCGNDRKIIGDFAEYIIDRLEKAKERIEILESIKWAQEHQNQVYYIVEHALDSIDAKIQIMQQFKFSENQAQAIIDMRVRAFSVDEREKIANELQEIFEWIKHFPEL